jgi:hypothetical protein
LISIVHESIEIPFISSITNIPSTGKGNDSRLEISTEAALIQMNLLMILYECDENQTMEVDLTSVDSHRLTWLPAPAPTTMVLEEKRSRPPTQDPSVDGLEGIYYFIFMGEGACFAFLSW